MNKTSTVAADSNASGKHGRWKTKKAKREHFSKILNEARLGEPLVEHYGDLLNLLMEHPAAEEKIGAGVLSFKVDLVPPFFSRGFFLTRVDGTTDDFSYRICLDGRPSPKQKATRAFRNEIHPQIDRFRSETFANGTARCVITGVHIENRTAEIDHIPPNTFAKLVNDFLRNIGLGIGEIETVSTDGGVTYCFVDHNIRVAWQEYHASHANLRAVSPQGHKLSHANDNTTANRSAA